MELFEKNAIVRPSNTVQKIKKIMQPFLLNYAAFLNRFLGNKHIVCGEY